MKSRIVFHAVALLTGSVLGLTALVVYRNLAKSDLPVDHSEAGVAKSGNAGEEVKHPETATVATVDVAPTGFVDSFYDRVARARAFESERRSAWELERVFEVMTPQDAPAIWELIYGQADKQKSVGLLDPFFGKWGEIDGASALAAAESLEGLEKDGLTKTVFNHWAIADLNGAWEAAQVYLDNQNSKIANLGRGVIQEMALQNPDFLINILNTDEKRHLSGTIRDKLVETAFDSGQPEKLIERLDALTDAEARKKLQSELFARWGEDDTDAAVSAIMRLRDPSDAEAAMTGFMEGWSRSDPSGAFEYAFANQGEPAVSKTFSNLLRRKMSSASPEEKKALIDRIEEAGLLDKHGFSLSYGLGPESYEAALALADRITDERQSASIKSNALMRMAQNDYPAAKSYYDKIESVALRERVFPNLVYSAFMGQGNGVELSSLFGSIPPSEMRSKLLVNLMKGMAEGQFKPNEGVRTEIRKLAESDTELPENGKVLFKKLFGE